MVDQSRRSPLHYAVEKGLTRIVQVVDGGESNDDEGVGEFFRCSMFVVQFDVFYWCDADKN